MALTIRALDRGGWSAYGGGRYDPRADAVVIAGYEDEELSTTVSFNETISSVTEEENGIASTTPSISTTTATMELSGYDSGGVVEFLFTLASGQKRRLAIIAHPTSLNSDYGRRW